MSTSTSETTTTKTSSPKSFEIATIHLTRLLRHAKREHEDGLNHHIREDITESMVNGQKVTAYCGLRFYPRAMNLKGEVHSRIYERCEVCRTIKDLEELYDLKI